MTHREHLTAICPLYGLTIRTARLTLRPPDEADIAALARALVPGVQAPETPRFQADWLYAASPARERRLLKTVSGAVSRWTPDDWELNLAVFLSDDPVGMQRIFSHGFGVTRAFGTGSWLTFIVSANAATVLELIRLFLSPCRSPQGGTALSQSLG